MELPDFIEAQAFFKKVQFYGFLKNFDQIQSWFCQNESAKTIFNKSSEENQNPEESILNLNWMCAKMKPSGQGLTL